MGAEKSRRCLKAVFVVMTVLIAGAAAPSEKFEVTSAVWRPDRNELRIEGSASNADEVVLVRNADTKAFVGSAAVRVDGKWLLKVRSPKSVPARLRVEYLGTTTECPVERPDRLQ